MKCPFCKQEIKDNSKFCAKCGKEIPRCPGCGKVIYKRTRFCTNDGTPLPENVLMLFPGQQEDLGAQEVSGRRKEAGANKVEMLGDVAGNSANLPVQPQKKKGKGVFIGLAVAVAIVMFSAFGFLGYIALSGNLTAVISKFGLKVPVSRQEEENVGGFTGADGLDSTAGTTADGITGSTGEIAADREPDMILNDAADKVTGGQGDIEADYSNIDINAVDHQSVEVSGIVKNNKQQCILELKKKSSVCAYDLTDKVVVADNVKSLIFSNGSNMGEYDGAQVTVNAGISADASGQFVLAVTEVEIDKEYQDGEDAYLHHTYEFIMGDVNWEEAFDDCIRRGGYLARINSEQEFLHVVKLAEDQGMQKIHFYLGGKRGKNRKKYYWVDEKGKDIGKSLNSGNGIWTEDYWMANEPSFSAGGDEEMYMNLIYYQNHWVLNDVPLDITKYYAGQTAYICEYDE